MTEAPFDVREAVTDDVDNYLEVFESVAAERRWIAAESPIDREPLRAAFGWRLETKTAVCLVAVERGTGAVVGFLNADMRIGITDIGMAVAADWRGRGVGSALLTAAIDWARTAGSHKIHLSLWPGNEAAHRLYRRFGFEDEGRLRRHYRRRNGELWDALVMGLVLDEDSPGGG